MSRVDFENDLGPFVRSLQIVVAALLMGVVMFTGVAVFIQLPNQRNAQQPGLGLLTMVAIGFAAMATAAGMVVPAAIVKNSRRRIKKGDWTPPQGAAGSQQLNRLLSEHREAGKLAMVYQTKTIVAAALPEGAAFFANIAYLLEGSFISLGLVAALLLVIVGQFPTVPRVSGWIEEQLRLIAED